LLHLLLLRQLCLLLPEGLMLLLLPLQSLRAELAPACDRFDDGATAAAEISAHHQFAGGG
jgi:hypothetical protein